MPDLPPIPPVATLDALTPQSFATEILHANRPVLIKGLLNTWPSVIKGRESADAVADYLKAMDNGRPTMVLEASPAVQGRFTYGADMHDFNFNKRSKPISAGIDQLLAVQDHPNPPYTYIQSTIIRDYLPRFLLENPNPILPPSIEPRIWISNRTRAQTHNDNDHNLACVVAGHRRFTLFPPEQVINLYIGPMDHTPSGRAISLASLEEPDFARFPKFEAALAHAQVADMAPGDVLYVPKYWWHHVQSLDSFNILVNYWWGNSANTAENPMSAFLAGLIALKDMSPADKVYWKAMFDHYIFQVNGDPLTHIPPEHRGGLGRVTPRMRETMIKSLQQAVNGKGPR